MRTVVIPAPVDMHVHFRQGQMLRNVVPFHDRVFEYALAMPNTKPPIRNGNDVLMYETFIQGACDRMKPLIAIKLMPDTTPDTIADAHKCGAIAAKLYPEGATHNSEDGIGYQTIATCAGSFWDMLGAMQQLGMILCIHGEVPHEFSMDAEKAFLYAVRNILKKFPRLRVVLEHITTRDAICFVKDFDNCAATITLHHLLITHDDVAGRKIRPHNFCLPIAKHPKDMEALRRIIFNRHPRFFFGSDSAPHLLEDKECAEGCAGCFTAPILVEGLCHVFSMMLSSELEMGTLLKGFTSDFPRSWYKLPAPSYEITLQEEEWQIPGEIAGVVPFMAGKRMTWKVCNGNG